MGKKNKPLPKQVTEEKKEAPVEEVKTEVQEIIEEVLEQTEIVEAEVDGVDSLLNIRSTPEVKEGNVITQIKKGTRIQVVDPKKAKEPWYRIIVTDPKTEGYAMKKYIKIV